MSGLFKEVALSWGGQEYTVPADKVMRLIAIVEDIITLEELVASSGRKRVKISEAYAAALRYAGCRVTDEDVYASLFSADSAEVTVTAINGLLMMMVPPAQIVADDAKKKPAAKVKTARSSSRPRI